MTGWPSKQCPCGARFVYDERRGPAEWERRRFCSRTCGGRGTRVQKQDARKAWTSARKAKVDPQRIIAGARP